eukprot:SAG31_NODE_2637_length_5336_cov_2.105977_7_plen_67_part_00
MPKDTTFLVHLRIEKLVDGRKGYLRAWIEDRNGNRMVDATSLYVVPRKAVTPEVATIIEYERPRDK